MKLHVVMMTLFIAGCAAAESDETAAEAESELTTNLNIVKIPGLTECGLLGNGATCITTEGAQGKCHDDSCCAGCIDFVNDQWACVPTCPQNEKCHPTLNLCVSAILTTK